MLKPITLAVLAALSVPSAMAAGNTLFDDVAPLTGANTPIPVGSPLEATNPLLLPDGLTQKTIVSRSDVSPDLNSLSSGRYWDMIDTNRTGPDAGRYLFMPFEPSNLAGPNTASGALRVNLQTGTATTIVPVGTQNWQRGDASRWAPWGGWITGEENWSPSSVAVEATGRLFEVTNPTTATEGTGNLVQRNNVIPRVSHEGLAFDSQKSFYFIDENSSGSFYKFVSANPNASSGDDYFAAGTTYALKVGAGNNASAAGAFTWEALDPFNTNGRSAADNVGATAYNRPEDMEVKTLGNGDEAIMFTATGTHDVWTVNLTQNTINQFVSRDTIDIATGVAVGSALASPDNLAIDADGNIYIVEDQPTPSADIWLAKDTDNDGVAEYVQRWAAMQVTGAEPTGLFFDPYQPNVAYVNIQHPDSLNDRLVQITAAVPEPETYAMMLAGLGLIGAFARRRRG